MSALALGLWGWLLGDARLHALLAAELARRPVSAALARARHRRLDRLALPDAIVDVVYQPHDGVELVVHVDGVADRFANGHFWGHGWLAGGGHGCLVGCDAPFRRVCPPFIRLRDGWRGGRTSPCI